MDHWLCAGVAGDVIAALGPAHDVSAAQRTLLGALAACMQARLHDTEDVPWHAATQPLVTHALALADVAMDVMRAMVHTQQGDAPLLVRAHMGLLPLLECIHVASMRGQEDAGARRDTAATELLAHARTSGLVATCVRLLREARTFHPPQAPWAPAGRGAAPAGHAPSALHTQAAAAPDRPALPHLNRAALQVLSTLAFSPPQLGAVTAPDVVRVQDEVRELGGLYDVLALTALDEHNPCTWRGAR